MSLIWCLWFDYVFFGFDKYFFVVSNVGFVVLFKYVGFFDGKVNLFRFNIGNLIMYWSCFNVKCFDDVECSSGSMRLIYDSEEVVVVVDFDI